jgi:oligosaccharide repeat unit polymerase
MILGVCRLIHNGRAPLTICILLAQLLINVTLVSRSQIILIGVVCAVIVSSALSLGRSYVEPVVISVLGSSLIGYFIIVGQALGKTYDYVILRAGDFAGPDIFRPLASAYVYIAANIPAFDGYMFHHQGEYTWGLFGTLPVAKFLQHVGLLQHALPNEVGDFVEVPFLFNTYTYLNVFYRDFGIFGALLCPLLVGYIGNRFYLRACRQGRLWDVVAAAFLIHASFLSIATNVMVSTPQWEFALALWIMARTCRRETRRAVATPAFRQIRPQTVRSFQCKEVSVRR